MCVPKRRGSNLVGLYHYYPMINPSGIFYSTYGMVLLSAAELSYETAGRHYIKLLACDTRSIAQ